MKISLFFFDINLMLLSEDNCNICVCVCVCVCECVGCNFAGAEFPKVTLDTIHD